MVKFVLFIESDKLKHVLRDVEKLMARGGL
jgi:hypothetical protein